MLNHFLFTLILLLVLQAASPTGANQQQCYFPKGNLANTGVPCGDGETHSHCCGLNSICLSNGLCLFAVGSFELSRGTCTDPTWQSPNCPSYCANVNIGGGVPLSLYSFHSKNSSLYCCGTTVLRSGALACQLGGGPFTIEPANVIPDKGFLKDYSVTGGQNQPEPTNEICSGETGRATLIAVGTGLGVPLGLLSIAMLSWALWERKRRRDESTRLQPALAAAQNSEKIEHGDQGPFRPPVCELRHEREPAELN